jgi:hypothetical protein
MQDTTIRSQFLLLGTTSPVLGSISLFSNNEPLDVSKITVTLSSSAPSVDSLLLYDQDKRYLGRATLSQGQYVANIGVGVLMLPRRESVTVYARARVSDREHGGASGEQVQLASFLITSTGEWSADNYSQTFSDTFPSFRTSRSRIISIQNADGDTGTLAQGAQEQIASFTFTSELSSGDSDALLTNLVFQNEAHGVILSNAKLMRADSDEQLTCTTSTAVITCNNIPVSIGSMKSGSLTLRVYADVALDPSATSPSLRLTLNAPGTPVTDGDLTWSDGTSSFTWVPFDAPIARGTSFK